MPRIGSGHILSSADDIDEANAIMEAYHKERASKKQAFEKAEAEKADQVYEEWIKARNPAFYTATYGPEAAYHQRPDGDLPWNQGAQDAKDAYMNPIPAQQKQAKPPDLVDQFLDTLQSTNPLAFAVGLAADYFKEDTLEEREARALETVNKTLSGERPGTTQLSAPATQQPTKPTSSLFDFLSPNQAEAAEAEAYQRTAGRGNAESTANAEQTMADYQPYGKFVQPKTKTDEEKLSALDRILWGITKAAKDIEVY